MRARPAQLPLLIMRLAQSLTLLLALTVASSAAIAVEPASAHYETRLIAWSGDGSAALVEERVAEANGGTVYALQVVSGAERGKRYVLSSIPKPDARKPQKVSDKACAKTLGKLKADLEARGIGAVTVAAACGDRSGLITVGEQADAGVADSWFSGEGAKLTRSNWSVSVVRNTLSVAVDGEAVATWPDTPHYLRLKASVSKDGRLLLIFNEWLGGNSTLVLAAYTKTGAPADLKELRL